MIEKKIRISLFFFLSLIVTSCHRTVRNTPQILSQTPRSTDLFDVITTKDPQNKICLVRRSDSNVTVLPLEADKVQNVVISPVSTHLAYVKDRNVFVFDLRTNQERQLTQSPNINIRYGATEFVGKAEKDEQKGLLFSPDGKKLVYTMVNTYEGEQPSSKKRDCQKRKGALFQSRHTHVEVRLIVNTIDSSTERVSPNGRWVKWEFVKFPYLGHIAWPANSPLKVVVKSSNQDKEQVLAVNESDGSTQVWGK